MGKDGRKQEEWFCRFCTTSRGECYTNRKGNTSCHSCNYSKDRCFGGKVVPRGERGSPSRRVTGRGGQGGGAEDKVKALEEKNKKLEEKCKRLESGDKDDAADDGAPAAKSEASKKLAADIEEQRKVVKFFQDLEGTLNAVPEGLRSAEARLQEMVQQRQEAKPPSARLREAQAAVTRREKALATAEKSVAELDEQAKKLQEKRTTAVATGRCTHCTRPGEGRACVACGSSRQRSGEGGASRDSGRWACTGSKSSADEAGGENAT